MLKVVIIGANHAGLATARYLLESGRPLEITVIDKNSSLGYIAGATPLLIGNKISSYRNFFSADTEWIAKHVTNFYTDSEVIKVDFGRKRVFAKESNGRKFNFKYDKLVLATGSRQQDLMVENNELSGIYKLKDLKEALLINQKLSTRKCRNVAVIGGGYIGVEMAEALQARHKNVSLFEVNAHVLNTHYDKEFAQLAQQKLSENGVQVQVDEEILKFEGYNGKLTGVVTPQGSYSVDMVILAVGFLPNTQLGRNYLTCFTNGAYIVNSAQQTSDPDVYAVGDCATSYSEILKDQMIDFSVADALRGSYAAAKSIVGEKIISGGTVMTNAVRVYGLNFFATGLTTERAHKYGLEVEYVDYEDWVLLPAMLNNNKAKVRLIYTKEDRYLVGAQVCSEADLSGNISTLTLAIQKEMTIDELSFSKFFFYPYFNLPNDLLVKAAQTSENK